MLHPGTRGGLVHSLPVPPKVVEAWKSAGPEDRFHGFTHFAMTHMDTCSGVCMQAPMGPLCPFCAHTWHVGVVPWKGGFKLYLRGTYDAFPSLPQRFHHPEPRRAE